MSKISVVAVANEAIAEAQAERAYETEQAIYAVANLNMSRYEVDMWQAFRYAEAEVVYNMSAEQVAYEDAILWDDMEDC